MTKTVSDFLHFQKQIEKYMSEMEIENERWAKNIIDNENKSLF